MAHIVGIYNNYLLKCPNRPVNQSQRPLNLSQKTSSKWRASPRNPHKYLSRESEPQRRSQFNNSPKFMSLYLTLWTSPLASIQLFCTKLTKSRIATLCTSQFLTFTSSSSRRKINETERSILTYRSRTFQLLSLPWEIRSLLMINAASANSNTTKLRTTKMN